MSNNEYLPKSGYPQNRQVGEDHATQTQCLEFSPNGKMKKWNKRWWVMIDENKDYVTNQNLQ